MRDSSQSPEQKPRLGGKCPVEGFISHSHRMCSFLGIVRLAFKTVWLIDHLSDTVNKGRLQTKTVWLISPSGQGLGCWKKYV